MSDYSKTTLVDSGELEIYEWAKSVKRFWLTILDLITYFFIALADHGVEIASRAIALGAPVPNAVSVYYIVKTELHFHPVAAVMTAAVIELIGFFLIERALAQLDSLFTEMSWESITKFSISLFSVIVGVSIVIYFVYQMESLKQDGHRIMAWWPVLSLCVFTSQGLHIWDKKSRNKRAMNRNKTQQTQHNVPRDASRLHHDAIVALTEGETALIEWFKSHEGEHKLSSIAAELNVSKSTISRNIVRLLSDKLVMEIPRGNTNYYQYVNGVNHDRDN